MDNNLIPMTEGLNSTDLAVRRDVAEAVLEEAFQAVKQVYESMDADPHFVLAELLLKFYKQLDGLHEKQLNAPGIGEARFYVALLQFHRGDPASHEVLFEFAKRGERDHSYLAMTKLSEVRHPGLEELVASKLVGFDFGIATSEGEEVMADYLMGILDVAKVLGMELPKEFMGNLPAELPWQVKAALGM